MAVTTYHGCLSSVSIIEAPEVEAVVRSSPVAMLFYVVAHCLFCADKGGGVIPREQFRRSILATSSRRCR